MFLNHLCYMQLEQKQKYAAWKAADIRKALKEGRKPVPGPPGGDTDLSVPSSTYTSTNVSLICDFLFHKFIFHVVKEKNGSDLCMCVQ